MSESYDRSSGFAEGVYSCSRSPTQTQARSLGSAADACRTTSRVFTPAKTATDSESARMWDTSCSRSLGSKGTTATPAQASAR